MADDVLIDLGPKWGHVVPLGVLERINHIELTEDNHINVSCDTSDEERERKFEFKSRKAFEEDELISEKNRLLAFSNGLVSKKDLENILASMEAQTGVKPEDILSEPVYDVSVVRRLWANERGEPFFRFALLFDPVEERVLVAEDHNEEFNTIVEEWCDPEVVRHMNSEERMLIFAFEVLYRMAEPILPENEEGAFTDPFADVPVMGVQGVKTRVDLGKTDDEQIIVGSDK